MSAVIANGTYKILNVGHSGSGVDLIHGRPFGTVSGFVDDGDSIHRKWRVWNFGSNGNQIILESIAARGSYASAYANSDEAPILGAPNPTVWTVRRVGDNQFQLTTADGLYAWFLPRKDNYTTIILKPTGTEWGLGVQWNFKLIVE